MNTFRSDRTEYQIGNLEVYSDGDLYFKVYQDLTTVSQRLVLHVGDETFRFQDADIKGDSYRLWRNSGLSWSAGETVELRLVAPTATPATGKPGIAGRAQVGQRLTATKGGMQDGQRPAGDGLPDGLFLPVGAGGRGDRDRHRWGDVSELHTGRGRCRQDDQGQGDLHRRRRHRGDAHEQRDGRGDGALRQRLVRHPDRPTNGLRLWRRLLELPGGQLAVLGPVDPGCGRVHAQHDQLRGRGAGVPDWHPVPAAPAPARSRPDDGQRAACAARRRRAVPLRGCGRQDVKQPGVAL